MGYGCGHDRGRDHDHHDHDGVLSDHGCAYGCYHDYAYAQNDHGYDHVQSGYVCDLCMVVRRHFIALLIMALTDYAMDDCCSNHRCI